MPVSTICKAALLMAIWYVLLPSPAQAYFDLGVGTYLVQMILAFLAAFWLSFRQSWIGKLPFMKQKQAKLENTSTEETVSEHPQT